MGLAAACNDTLQYVISSDASTVADTSGGDADFDVEDSDTAESDSGESDVAEQDAEAEVEQDAEIDTPEPDVANAQRGNDDKEEGEFCDGDDLGDATCVAL